MTAAVSHNALVRIAGWGGEAQLVAAADVEKGVLLVGEYPLAFVETREGEDDEGPWLLLEAVLSAPDWFERVTALDLKMTKWPLSAADEARIERLAQQYRRNPKKLAQLYHRVAANNVRYVQGGVIGYGIWPIISRSNHSCDPNARLSGAIGQPLVELLLATRPIAAGEAICWNYYSDPAFGTLDWFERNRRLRQDFQFLCRCARCLAEQPVQVAGMSNASVAAYFQRRLSGSAPSPAPR